MGVDASAFVGRSSCPEAGRMEETAGEVETWCWWEMRRSQPSRPFVGGVPSWQSLVGMVGRTSDTGDVE